MIDDQSRQSFITSVPCLLGGDEFWRVFFSERECRWSPCEDPTMNKHCSPSQHPRLRTGFQLSRCSPCRRNSGVPFGSGLDSLSDFNYLDLETASPPRASRTCPFVRDSTCMTFDAGSGGAWGSVGFWGMPDENADRGVQHQ